MDILALLTFLLFLLAGGAGVILPFLPGVPLAAVGVLFAAWLGAFQVLGLREILIAALLAGLSLVLDYLATVVGARWYGASTRGVWGETQLRALLDDHLPHGGYETNRKLRPDGDEMVEFAVVMPVKGDTRPVLAIDAKFPLEDYERLVQAAEAGDAEGERLARRGLEQRMRAEARKIASKYINPPVTVEFAVLYLPTDGLYVEVARVPGLIEELGRVHRVLVVGPSLCPALLRTIQLGFMTLALEQKAGQIHELLGATRGEMARMDEVLSKLSKQANVLGSTIEAARTRTRVVQRKLRTVDALDAAQADALLDLGDVAEAAE